MPELPEVETIVNDLNKKIINRKIENVQIKLARLIKNRKKNFLDFVIGNKFTKISRRGKLIIFYFKTPLSFSRKRESSNNKLFMLIHLKMTGQLIYKNKNKIIAGGHSQDKTLDNLPNKYTHVIFDFSDRSQLLHNDLRQFGYLKLVNKKELDKILNKFGYEPLEPDFTFVNFKKLIKNRRKNVKAFLLDQSLVAGIGNIYADEVLFASGVHPERSVDDLRIEEIKKIYINIKRILKKAIKYRGTTFNDYRDADGNKGSFVKMLKVYGRDGEKCLVCGTIIKKIKAAGRGTRYCAKCQVK